METPVPILLNSTADVMDKLGGIGATGAMFGLSYRAAHNWKQAGKFPARTYREISAALHARGFSASVELWDWARHPEVTE